MANIPPDQRIVRRLAELATREDSIVYPYDLRTEEGRQAYIAFNEADWQRFPAHKKDWRGQVNAHVRQSLIASLREESAANLIHAHLLETEPLARIVEYRVQNDRLCYRVISVNGWGQQTYVDHTQKFDDEVSASEEARLLNESLGK